MPSPALRAPLALAVCLAVALAGCTGSAGPDESTDANDTNRTPVSARSSFDVFTITDFAVAAEGLPGENASAFYEDAALNVSFTVTNGGDRASSEFVTLLVDGSVEFTERVHLAPGAVKDFAHAFEARDEPGTFTVAVRAAEDRVEESVELLPRARVGDAQESVILHATAARVFADRPGHTTVNLTLANPTDANDSHAPTKAGVRLLCAPTTGDGAAFTHGWFEFTPPAPGNATIGDVPLPKCPSGSGTLAVQVLAWDRAGGDPIVFTWLTR